MGNAAHLNVSALVATCWEGNTAEGEGTAEAHLLASLLHTLFYNKENIVKNVNIF
jgi:hypothetical protein